jgi:peptidoglycan lytic transglycosylase
MVASVTSRAGRSPRLAAMARWCGCLLSVVTTLAGEGCVASSRTPVTLAPAPSPRPAVQEGHASWYGEAHHGQRTASGERFDMNALTAAHPTLPFGTRLRVVNLDNDRAVDVRVNDRGPIVPGRIIDLSYAAARALGALGTGIIPVRLTVLGSADRAPQTPPNARSAPAQP